MFISTIFVLRKLDLTRGRLEAEEAAPIVPVTLEKAEEEEDVGTIPGDLGKEDSD